MASIDRTLRDIERKYGARVSRAFAEAISELRNSVVMRRVIDQLESGDIEGALDAIGLDESVFSTVRRELAEALAESGTALVAGVKFDPPGETRAVVRWNVGNPEAVRALNEWLGGRITQVTEDARAATRAALSEGFARGQGPRQIALDVVGRVGPNGKRSGGVLGLNQQQAQLVGRMRYSFENGFLSDTGIPLFWIKRDGSLGSKFSKRDRRFDGSILKLLKEGKTPTKAQIDKWTGRYSDRLLKLRGDTIARTETASAVEQGRFDGFRQGMDAKGYPYQYAIKEWRHGGGGMKPRVQHVAEDEVIVRGLFTPFVMPDGTQLLYPHDPAAPPGHVINCTCSLLIRMDWVRMRQDGII